MPRSFGRAALLLGLGIVPPGCGEAERPAFAADIDRRDREAPSLVDTEEPPPPTLESPCGAATVALEFQRPNLYFAIDASGSMLEPLPITDSTRTTANGIPIPSDRYGVLSLAIQELLMRVGHRVNYGATVFPSRDAACDEGEEISALAAGDLVSFAVSGEMGPRLTSFMYSINRRAPTGGTPVGAALRGLLPKLQGSGSETFVFLVTDGGPNCDRAARCGPEACIPNIEHVQLSPSLTCEAPLNCCDETLFGSENCLDQAGSRAAVAALAEAGVRTFVIGIPGSDEYANLLDQLAFEGGVPRPPAETPSYYRVSDAEQLIDTVSQLGLGVALSCTLELIEPVPDPRLVNVYFDSQIVPADPVNGWAFVDSQTVQLLGSSCDLLRTGQVLRADVVAGCPIVLR